METTVSVLGSIFIGVVSGIVTSALLWIIVKLFQNTLLPWYASLVYRGQNISGEWEGYAIFPNKTGKEKPPIEEKCSIINLKQKGHNISGELLLLKQPNGERENKKLKLTGVFYDNSLILTYEAEDKTRFGLGTCVFRLIEDGQRLEGYWTAVNSLSTNVFSNTEYWLRKK